MHIKSKKAYERNCSESRKRLAYERTCAYEMAFANRPMYGKHDDIVRSSLNRPASRGDSKNHVRIVASDGHCCEVVSVSVGRDIKRGGQRPDVAIVDCRPIWRIRHHG